MRLNQILTEVAVMSSWIEDLEYEDDEIIMTLNSGRMYSIAGVPEGMYREWLEADSKGKYWHSDIRDFYRTNRI